MFKFIFYPLLLSLLVFAYTLFVPLQSTQEKVFLISKHFSIESDLINQEIDGYYIIDRKECGYFSTNHGMATFFQCDDDQYIIANIYGYCLFDKVGETITFFSPLEEKICQISNPGYPFLLKEIPYIYVTKTNGMGFALYNLSGKMIYQQEFNSVITSLSADKDVNTLVSTLDGKSYLININGEITFSIENHSQIKMAKSNAIEINGNNFAVCSGLKPEIIEIFDKNTKSKLKKIETNNHFPYQIFMEFQHNRLYYEDKYSISSIHLKSFKLNKFDFKGELLDITFSNNGNLLLLSEENNITYLYLYTINGLKIYFNEFEESIDNIAFVDDYSFYFRLNRSIVKISC
ncbi:MAG: hypothetical protein MJB14_06990 [Spirochaetes bacterium]|nr:hypothetical protein [Spirochaetota bacterium]